LSVSAAIGKLAEFSFVFRGIGFAVRCDEGDDETLAVRVAGDLGPLPYSLQSREARRAVLTIIASANETFGRAVFRIGEDNRLVVGGKVRLEPPVTPVRAVAAAASVVHDVLPYLECIAVFLRPPRLPRAKGDGLVMPAWENLRH
jgi:hypothetical protein